MDKHLRDNLLKGMSSRTEGEALKDWLDESEARIRDVETCKTEAEMLGRQFALKEIHKLFKFLYPVSTPKGGKVDYS